LAGDGIIIHPISNVLLLNIGPSRKKTSRPSKSDVDLGTPRWRKAY